MPLSLFSRSVQLFKAHPIISLLLFIHFFDATMLLFSAEDAVKLYNAWQETYGALLVNGVFLVYVIILSWLTATFIRLYLEKGMRAWYLPKPVRKSIWTFALYTFIVSSGTIFLIAALIHIVTPITYSEFSMEYGLYQEALISFIHAGLLAKLAFYFLNLLNEQERTIKDSIKEVQKYEYLIFGLLFIPNFFSVISYELIISGNLGFNISNITISILKSFLLVFSALSILAIYKDTHDKNHS